MVSPFSVHHSRKTAGPEPNQTFFFTIPARNNDTPAANRVITAETIMIRENAEERIIGPARRTGPEYPAMLVLIDNRMLANETPRAIPRFLTVALTLDAIPIFSAGSELMISVLLGLWKRTMPIVIGMNASIIRNSSIPVERIARRIREPDVTAIPAAA